jgi:O-antigen/teichoic acid export membrane protein
VKILFSTARNRTLSPTEGSSPPGRLLAANALWNLLGLAIPALVALPAVRLLIQNLGATKYGVLTLAFVIVGYFGVFDAGLGSALTKLLAERVGRSRDDEITSLFWTGCVLLAGLGLLGAVTLAALSHQIVYCWLRTPLELRADTCIAFRIFALALPFVIALGAFRGGLAAHHRFDLINKVRITFGILSFVVPLTVLPFSHSLVLIISLIAVVRVGNCLLFGYLCFRIIPGLSFPPRWHRGSVKPLVSFGAWITASNVFAPLLVYSDRFILGSLLSLSAVSYYSIPLDVVTKLWVIPDSLTGALFPAFVSSIKSGDGGEMRLLERTADYLFPALLAPILLTVVFAHQLLTIWLGPAFAAHSTVVLKWVAAGTLVNSMARGPYSMLLAANHPDLAAKLHLLESPIYIPFLCLLIHSLGVEGAAIAWTIRMSFNAVALHVMIWYLLPGSKRAVRKNAMMMLTAVSAMAATCLVPDSLFIRLSYLVIALAIAILVTWFRILSVSERRSMATALSKLGGGGLVNPKP